MKTEDEARKCWCPFARYPFGNIDDTFTGINRPRLDKSQAHPSCLCIASECMAWRWGTIPGQIKSITIDTPLYSGVGNATAEIEPDGPRRGFCGLAGKP